MNMEYYDTLCSFRNRDADKYRILWEITSRCNERCRFCLFRGNKETSMDEVKKIVDNIGGLPVKDIILTGGEPLLNKDIFHIMDYLMDKGYEIDICSNGTLIDQKTAEELSRRVNEISISLDTVDRQKYQLLRGRDLLGKAEEGIKNLIDRGVEVHLTFVVTRSNMDEIEKVAYWAQEMKAHSISYQKMIVDLAQDSDFSGSERIDPREVDECMERINRLRKDAEITINTKRLVCEQEGACKAGINILAITSDARLISCIMNKKEAGIDLLQNRVQVTDLKGKKAENICVI